MVVLGFLHARCKRKVWFTFIKYLVIFFDTENQGPGGKDSTQRRRG